MGEVWRWLPLATYVAVWLGLVVASARDRRAAEDERVAELIRRTPGPLSD